MTGSDFGKNNSGSSPLNATGRFTQSGDVSGHRERELTEITPWKDGITVVWPLRDLVPLFVVKLPQLELR